MAIGKYTGVNRAIRDIGNTFDDIYSRNRQAEIDMQQAKTREMLQQNQALRNQALQDQLNSKNNFNQYLQQLKPADTGTDRVAGLVKYAQEKGDGGMLQFSDLLMSTAPNTLRGFQTKQDAEQMGTILGQVQALKRSGQWNDQTAQALFQQMPKTMQEFFPGGFNAVDDSGAVIVPDPKTGETIGYMIRNPQSGKVIFQAAAKEHNAATGQLNPDGSLTLENGMIYSKAQLENMAETYTKTGKMPTLGMKAGPLRQAIMYYHTKNAVNKGNSGTDVAVNWAVTGADTKSLANQTKNFDMASSFITNIDKQVDRFESVIAPVIDRLDTRLANVPINKWTEVIAGDPEWQKYKMYITEISSETARLASGNPQSIAELSQAAREKWENIHDINLKPSEMLSLLKETQHAAHMRYDSLAEQLKKTTDRMRSNRQPGSKNTKPLTKDIAKQLLQEAGGDKDAARKLAKERGYTF